MAWNRIKGLTSASTLTTERGLGRGLRLGRPGGAAGSAPSAWGYAGEYQEGQTGPIYLRARWHDPATGRFLTRDPFRRAVHGADHPTSLRLRRQRPHQHGRSQRVDLPPPGGRPEDYLQSGGFWRSVGVGAASGAVAGVTGFGVGALVGGAGLGGAIAGGMLSGGVSGAAAQATANLLTPCVNWHDNVAEAAVMGSLTGGVAERRAMA